MATKHSSSKAHPHKKGNATCWKGYKRVAGTKPYSKGSCEKA